MSIDVRILILNTSLASCAPIERELQKAGVPFATREIKTRPEIIETLHDATPDLLLNQCLFPEYDGLSALQLARDLAPTLPFIMVADAKDDHAAELCLSKGVALFITPTDFEPLVAFVQRCFVEKGGVMPNMLKTDEKLSPIKTNDITSTAFQTKFLEEANDERVDVHDQETARQLSNAARRVKDALHIISSLLFLESQELRDADAENAISIFNRSRARVKVLALLYEQLSETKATSHTDFKTYLENIVSALMDIYDATPDTLQNSTTDELSIRIERAPIAGLIVTELLINALSTHQNNSQYGATKAIINAEHGSGDNHITIRLDFIGVTNDEILDQYAMENFSGRLIKLLAEELHATVDINEQRIEVKFEK